MPYLVEVDENIKAADLRNRLIEVALE